MDVKPITCIEYINALLELHNNTPIGINMNASIAASTNTLMNMTGASMTRAASLVNAVYALQTLPGVGLLRFTECISKNADNPDALKLCIYDGLSMITCIIVTALSAYIDVSSKIMRHKDHVAEGKFEELIYILQQEMTKEDEDIDCTDDIKEVLKRAGDNMAVLEDVFDKIDEKINEDDAVKYMIVSLYSMFRYLLGKLLQCDDCDEYVIKKNICTISAISDLTAIKYLAESVKKGEITIADVTRMFFNENV